MNAQTSEALKKNTVFIVDDHPLVRDWLARLIDEEHDLEVCGSCETFAEAISAIDRLKPDIIIVDIWLRGKSGLELIHFLTDRNPDEATLVLSMHDEAIYAHRAFRAGARGYVSKREATESVVSAIRKILEGGNYLGREVAESFAAGMSRGRRTGASDDVNLLSDRELEVFRLLSAGRETADIAADLFVSLKTVQSYCARIKEKMNLRNATELLQAATRWADAQKGL